MISLSTRVRLPKLEIKDPDKRFWQAVGITEAREIHKRTVSGEDADDSAFKPYSQSYKKYRISKGRSSRVNLNFTGRMLSQLARGIRAAGDRVTISLLGSSGAKASGIEAFGREFFSLSDKRQTAIFKRVTKWMEKKNSLK